MNDNEIPIYSMGLGCQLYRVTVPFGGFDKTNLDHFGYIHDFAKKSEYCIVGKMRRNGFSQRDVDRQWMQIVNMIRKKQISGVVVANMAAVSSSLADAYYKVGLIIEAGGVVATVDEGRLDMHIKEVS